MEHHNPNFNAMIITDISPKINETKKFSKNLIKDFTTKAIDVETLMILI